MAGDPTHQARSFQYVATGSLKPSKLLRHLDTMTLNYKTSLLKEKSGNMKNRANYSGPPYQKIKVH